MNTVTNEDLRRVYFACENCNKEAGGVFPKGHICTVSLGDCELCGAKNVTLIPWVDFNFPKNKQVDSVAKKVRD